MCGLPGYTMRVLRTISSSRAARHRRAAVRQSNAVDPVLERGARYDTTHIPLGEVSTEWWHNALSGRKSHLRSGIYYEVFQQILQCSPYTPISNFSVTYLPIETKPDICTNREETSDYIEPTMSKPNPVYLGNLLLPKSATNKPEINIDWSRVNTEFATILLANPDGYLVDNQFEILHWMVANIPRGNELMNGQVLRDYMQPLPFYGTGLHRYVFFLIEHNKPITYNQITTKDDTSEISKFEERIFLTSKFLADNEIVPSECVSFLLFQSMWDTSVSSCLINDLKVAEPYYKRFVPLTKGQLKGKKIREIRSNKYRIT